MQHLFIAVRYLRAEHGGKSWDYCLLSHDDVRINSSFEFLISNRVDNEQIELQFE